MRRYIGYTYPFFKIKRSIRARAYPDQYNLRVLLYHDVKPAEYGLLLEQFKWLTKKWDFISPSDFEALAAGKIQLKSNSLLLTFDDGFLSCKSVAERVLKPLGIKAIFFVITNLVDLAKTESAKIFINKRLNIGGSPEDIPSHLDVMSWSDLEELHQLGHTIGAHTATHEPLKEGIPIELLRKEIIVGADIIEKKLGLEINHFAFPFGDLVNFGPQAMEIAMNRFKFIYTGLRGSNYPDLKTYSIRRDSQKANDSRYLIGSFLEGAADYRYNYANKQMDRWEKIITSKRHMK